MHVNDLRIMAFNITNYKHQNMKYQNRNHKHTYGHYEYACAIDLGHTYQFKKQGENTKISPY